MISSIIIHDNKSNTHCLLCLYIHFCVLKTVTVVVIMMLALLFLICLPIRAPPIPTPLCVPSMDVLREKLATISTELDIVCTSGKHYSMLEIARPTMHTQSYACARCNVDAVKTIYCAALMQRLASRHQNHRPLLYYYTTTVPYS